MKRLGMLIAFVAAVSVGCNDRTDSANDRNDNAIGTSGDRDVSIGDKNFVHDLIIANMAEVDLGKLAAERGANAQVKQFGQMMVDDHTKAGDKLKAIATQDNIEMPTALDDKHRDLHDKLAKLQGAEFDREYMSAMVDGHEDVKDKLESRLDRASITGANDANQPAEATDADRRVGTAGKDNAAADRQPAAAAPAVTPEKSDNPVTMALNQWAADSYPVVNMHLQRARSLNDTVSKSGR